MKDQNRYICLWIGAADIDSAFIEITERDAVHSNILEIDILTSDPITVSNKCANFE